MEAMELSTDPWKFPWKRGSLHRRANVHGSFQWKLPWKYRWKFARKFPWKVLPWKLPWKLWMGPISTEVVEDSVEATSMGIHGSFHGSSCEIFCGHFYGLYFHGLHYSKASVETSGTSMGARQIINNILPLRHLHRSFNGFHGTRGSFHGTLHGLPPKRINRAGDRKRLTN